MVEGASIEHMLARVSIVDFEGRVLYDAYVKPREKVIDYRTAITGITKETLSRRGEAFKVVRARVLEILNGKVVVGHAIHHDFEALHIERPTESLVRDTCLFPRLRPPNRKQTPSLRLLAEYWLDKVVQTGSHSSVEDARTAMTLYKRFRTEWDESFKLQK
jgi:RNA exonuclease 4